MDRQPGVQFTWALRTLAAFLVLSPLAAGAEENGIRVGDGRLHPYFELETRYDSHVGFVGNGEGTGDVVEQVATPDVGMHYRPGFKLDVPSESVQLQLGGHVDFVQYLGTEREGTKEFSRVEGGADFATIFNPNGTVAVHLADRFLRGDRTSVMSLGVGAISNRNDASAKLAIQPGGKALVIEPGYGLTFEHFDDDDGLLAGDCPDNDPLCDTDSLNANDYLHHTFRLDASWQFLPKTRLVFDGAYGFRSYIGELEGEDGRTEKPLEKYNSRNLKVMAGVQGLLSRKVSITLKGGWGDQLKGDVGFKGAIGQAELGFLFSEQFQLRAGYLRSFEPHPGPSYFYSDDRGYANLHALLGGKLTLSGEVAYDRVEFGSDRADDVFTVGFGPSYEVTPWLTAGVGINVANRASSLESTLFDYSRTETYGRLRATY